MLRRNLPSAAWIAVGMVAVALLVPTIGAAATAQLVQIQGAAFSKGHEMKVTQAPPSMYRQYEVQNESNSMNSCVTVTTLPAANGMVVRELRADWFTASTYSERIAFYAGDN